MYNLVNLISSNLFIALLKIPYNSYDVPPVISCEISLKVW